MADDANMSLEDFLLMEAKERCYEIEIKGLKDFEKEKTRIVEKGKEDVREEFDKKLRNIEGQKRIERSSRINSSRLRKMQARNDVVRRILDDAEIDMARRIQNDKGFYREILKKLIIQAFIKLFEKRVILRCLERDKELVRELIPECVSEFQSFILKELEIEWPIEAEIDHRKYLQLRKLEDIEDPNQVKGLHKSDEDQKCYGGVLGCNEEMTIICKNTVDTRLELCFQDSLPPIRALLFPSK